VEEQQKAENWQLRWTDWQDSKKLSSEEEVETAAKKEESPVKALGSQQRKHLKAEKISRTIQVQS
jgi:hypothetical protein